jgi:hypothetical protein
MVQLPNPAEIDVAPEFLCLSFNACSARSAHSRQIMAALAKEENQ